MSNESSKTIEVDVAAELEKLRNSIAQETCKRERLVREVRDLRIGQGLSWFAIGYFAFVGTLHILNLYKEDKEER